MLRDNRIWYIKLHFKRNIFKEENRIIYNSSKVYLRITEDDNNL